MQLEHFKKSDHGFIIKCEDWIEQVHVKQRTKITSFLTPHEQEILLMMVRQQDGIFVDFTGGFAQAERKRASIYYDYMKPKGFKNQVSGFQIKYNKRFFSPQHRQVLGSLTALKIDRSLIGDIVFLPTGEIYFAVCVEFSSFIAEYFTMIGRETISLAKAHIQEVEKVNRFEKVEIMVASMRLDVLVASLINVSRSHVQVHLKQGDVQVNHVIEKNFSRTCQVGDLLSIKRHGRFKINAHKRTTKNGRLVIEFAKAI